MCLGPWARSAWFGGIRVVLHLEAELLRPAAHVLVALAFIDAPLDARIVQLEQVVEGDGEFARRCPARAAVVDVQ
eukprot:200067-Prymnesium_polylepis.1